MMRAKKSIPAAMPRLSLCIWLLAAVISAPLAAQTAAPEQKSEAAPAVDAAKVASAEAPKEAGMPEECTKLVGAIVACRQAGGWKQMLCEKGAKMQFDKCPIPVEKLPI